MSMFFWVRKPIVVSEFRNYKILTIFDPQFESLIFGVHVSQMAQFGHNLGRNGQKTKAKILTRVTHFSSSKSTKSFFVIVYRTKIIYKNVIFSFSRSMNLKWQVPKLPKIRQTVQYKVLNGLIPRNKAKVSLSRAMCIKNISRRMQQYKNVIQYTEQNSLVASLGAVHG